MIQENIGCRLFLKTLRPPRQRRSLFQRNTRRRRERHLVVDRLVLLATLLRRQQGKNQANINHLRLASAMCGIKVGASARMFIAPEAWEESLCFHLSAGQCIKSVQFGWPKSATSNYQLLSLDLKRPS